MRIFFIIAVLSFISTSIFAEPYKARGVIQPLHQATLSSEISALIVALPFQEAAPFKKGNTLVKFDCALFQAQQQKAQAELKAAKAKLENDVKLHKLRSIGKLDVELSQSAVQQASAEVSMTRINARRCTVKAPWDGYVVSNLVNEHESVNVNQALVKIISTHQLQVELIVPAAWIAWLKTGTTFQFLVDETGQTFPGKIKSTAKVVDATSHTIKAKAVLTKSHKLLPGMSGTAQFSVE